jgi:DMSO/TMAO reductase YedYZ molybdopterin-dependent catalytic subunit
MSAMHDHPCLEHLRLYAMNGESLPIQHGYLLQLIVPGWYTMALVKWLTEIELIGDALAGHYQARAYFYENRQTVRKPVRLREVRSLTTAPAADAELERGQLATKGVASLGAALIATFEVSLNGHRWQQARLVDEPNRHSWRWWELITRIEHRRAVTIRARATALVGGAQPEDATWNRLGHGNNSIQEVVARVR